VTRVAAKRSLDRLLEMTGGVSGPDVGRPKL
jgi:quinolinate synthase